MMDLELVILIILCFVIMMIENYGINNYKPLFYKMGIPICINNINFKNNHFLNNIGNEITKIEIKVKIIDENKIYFITYSGKNSISRWFYFSMFGECVKKDNNIKIFYKIPISFFIIPIFGIIYSIFYNDSLPFILGIILLIIAIFGGIIFGLGYLYIKAMKFEIEDFIING